MSKDLADKAIDIKGTDYVLVKDRIIYFNETYPNGSIVTELVTDALSDIVIVKAFIYPDGQPANEYSDSLNAPKSRTFTGYSQAVKGAGFINKTAALENAETSAVGRALAMMGIGVIDSVASVDEINKAQGTDSKLAKAKQDLLQAFKKDGVTDFNTQVDYIETVIGKRTVESVADAEKVIRSLGDEVRETDNSSEV